MEHWSKTSCEEPLPLGSRRINNKRKFVVLDQKKNKPVNVHVHHHPHKGGFFKRPIDSAPPNLSCVHVDTNQISPKQMRKMICNLWNGITAEAAITNSSSKSNLEIVCKSGHLDHQNNKKPMITATAAAASSAAKQIESRNAQNREMRDRNRVTDILHKFRDYCDKLSNTKRALYEEGNFRIRRVDIQSATKVKNELGYNSSSIGGKQQQYIGKVPGIEIGDRFYYRMELHIVGLHGPPRSGIETMNYGGQKIATSIIVSGGYSDYWKDVNTLIYCGHGGGMSSSSSSSWCSGSYNRKRREFEDQKLRSGNMALLNSKEAKNAVRVVRGEKKKKGKNDEIISPTIYIYDGLYTVEDVWKIKHPDYNKTIFNFKLIKIPGQS